METSTVSPHVNTSAAQSWLLWAGFILVSLNLRLIFKTVGPLLENLQLGFTSTLLVTTLPLALLGLFSMAGVRLRHWLGEERALFFALILLSLGCSVRGLGKPGFTQRNRMGRGTRRRARRRAFSGDVPVRGKVRQHRHRHPYFSHGANRGLPHCRRGPPGGRRALSTQWRLEPSGVVAGGYFAD